jgi:hypothetical protein
MNVFAHGLLRCLMIAAAAVFMPDAAAAEGGAAAAAAADTADGWLRIVPQPVTIDGRLYTPTCSNAPGTDPTFSYYFRKGTADGLVVFFNGGGACWNGATCSKPRIEGDRATLSGPGNRLVGGVYKAMLLPGDGPAQMGGIFDRSNPDNPVRKWSMLFVPYCTGDVHGGSQTAEYKMPATGETFSIEHRGWDNMQVVMHWMRTNVPRTARILVSGSSAGAYGAATHYPALRAMYPDARAVFLGDGGQGVTTPAFEQVRNRNWNYQLPASVFGPDAQAAPDAKVVAGLAAFFPEDRFAQFTTIQDATQSAFYAQMASTEDCNAWANKMSDELAERQSLPNFRSYVAAGDAHTILRGPTFYTEQSGGQRFTAWLDALLQHRKLPGNQACPTCKMPFEACPR